MPGLPDRATGQTLASVGSALASGPNGLGWFAKGNPGGPLLGGTCTGGRDGSGRSPARRLRLATAHRRGGLPLPVTFSAFANVL